MQNYANENHQHALAYVVNDCLYVLMHMVHYNSHKHAVKMTPSAI